MITPLDHTIKGVMEFTWPIVLISILVVSSLRIAYIVNNKQHFVFYREVFQLIFLIYILCLFQIVTFEDPSLSLTDEHFNLIPFQEISRYSIGSRLFFKNVIGNLVLFVPYGFFACYHTKINKWIPAFLMILFASVSIESTQLIIGRIFDIDDIILNLIGGMLGYGIYFILQKIKEHLPKVLRKDWFLNILSLLFVGGLIGYIWMVIR